VCKCDKSLSMCYQLSVVCWSSARQHKSQFEQLIEAARKNRAALKKPAVDVRDEEMNHDDGKSSTSSVELIADGEMLTSDAVCAMTDDIQPTVNEPLSGNF